LLALAGGIGGKPKTAKNHRFLARPLFIPWPFSREGWLGKWENLTHFLPCKVCRSPGVSNGAITAFFGLSPGHPAGAMEMNPK